jgi:hypothetical protein
MQAHAGSPVVFLWRGGSLKAGPCCAGKVAQEKVRYAKNSQKNATDPHGAVQGPAPPMEEAILAPRTFLALYTPRRLNDEAVRAQQ